MKLRSRYSLIKWWISDHLSWLLMTNTDKAFSCLSSFFCNNDAKKSQICCPNEFECYSVWKQHNQHHLAALKMKSRIQKMIRLTGRANRETWKNEIPLAIIITAMFVSQRGVEYQNRLLVITLHCNHASIIMWNVVCF